MSELKQRILRAELNLKRPQLKQELFQQEAKVVGATIKIFKAHLKDLKARKVNE